ITVLQCTEKYCQPMRAAGWRRAREGTSCGICLNLMLPRWADERSSEKQTALPRIFTAISGQIFADKIFGGTATSASAVVVVPPKVNPVLIRPFYPRKSAASSSLLFLLRNRPVREQREKCHQRSHRDDQRPREQHPEHLVVVLEVHVEQHHDGELRGREDEQRRHEEARGRERRIVDPDFANRDERQPERHPSVLLPGGMLALVIGVRRLIVHVS